MTATLDKPLTDYYAYAKRIANRYGGLYRRDPDEIYSRVNEALADAGFDADHKTHLLFIRRSIVRWYYRQRRDYLRTVAPVGTPLIDVDAIPDREPHEPVESTVRPRVPEMMRARTECPHGHSYNKWNTGRRKDGTRYCRLCARHRAYTRRKQREGGAS